MTTSGVPNKWLFLSGQDITSNNVITLTPPPGTVWKIHCVLTGLHTGTTAGTRSIDATINTPSTYTGDYNAEAIVSSGSQTGTSTTYDQQSGNRNTGAPSGGTSYYMSTPFVVPPGGSVSIVPSLVSGDSFLYYLIIEQVLTL